MLKNRFFTILVILALSVPVFAEPEFPEEVTSEQMVPIEQETTETFTQEELPKLDNIQYKQPVSKRRLAKKFLLAMSGVGVASLLLFLVLTLYNKVRESILGCSSETNPNANSSLETPEDLATAIKTFLDKTKWN